MRENQYLINESKKKRYRIAWKVGKGSHCHFTFSTFDPDKRERSERQVTSFQEPYYEVAHITSAHIHWPEYISARKPGKWSSLLCCQETRRSTDILLLEREMVEDWSSLNSLELEYKLKMLNQLHLGAKVFNGCGKTGQGMTVSRRDISRRAKCHGILVILVSSSWYNGHGRMNNFHRTAKKQSTWRARVSFWKWK